VGSGSTSASGATSNVLPAIDRNELASNRVPTTSQTAGDSLPVRARRAPNRSGLDMETCRAVSGELRTARSSKLRSHGVSTTQGDGSRASEAASAAEVRALSEDFSARPPFE
jgi:hypothetical protein